MNKAPFLAISRHRLAIDGQGVTTLVAFHGCPLHCRYCLNDMCHNPDRVWKELTPEELVEIVSIDNLYFLATQGGVTFGGGEPSLWSLFIEEFASIMDSRWRITMETSLHVPRSHVERLLPVVNQWIVDVKTMDADIYKQYTGCDNTLMTDNLRFLMSHEGMAEKVVTRLPLIPEYNTPDDVAKSRALLEEMGVKHFDEFEYMVNRRG